MSSRFQKLFALTPNLYAEECPVFIEAGALQKDTETGAVIAQLKMRNLEETPIVSCKVTLKAYENNGNEVEGVQNFSYLDLNAERGKEFGTKVPIMMPDRTARSFTVEINEIVLADGTVKKLTDNEWKSISPQKHLEEVISDSELRKQYLLEGGSSCSYYPEKRDGFYFCTCGAINLGEEQTCYKCGRSYDSVEPLLDIDYLREKVDQRHQKEAEAKQKNKKIAVIVGAVIAVLIIGSVIISSINKAISVPFTIGDSYDKVKGYMRAYASDYDTGTYATAVYGWVDYFGTGGDDYTQQISVYFDHYDNVDEININALAKYQTKIVSKIKRIYKVDASSTSAVGDTITMRGEGVKITIESGYEWKSTATHHPGEEIIIITIEEN